MKLKKEIDFLKNKTNNDIKVNKDYNTNKNENKNNLKKIYWKDL